MLDEKCPLREVSGVNLRDHALQPTGRGRREAKTVTNVRGQGAGCDRRICGCNRASRLSNANIGGNADRTNSLRGYLRPNYVAGIYPLAIRDTRSSAAR